MQQTTSTVRAMRTLVQTLALGLASVAAIPALAWTENKPVKILVPAPPGGTMDILARVLAEQLTTETGVPMIVDNKPGAGGAIGVKLLIAAPADGQTIMVAASNVLTEIPHVLKGGFDPLVDVKPVAAIVRSNSILVGAPDLPPQDLKSLIPYIKGHPGKISFASPSAGTVGHYSGMILNQKAGLDMQHVPFAGSPPGLAQVMGGQIPLMFDGGVTSMPLIKAGKIKAYGVAGKVRMAQLPQVPTFRELGYPELDMTSWFGVIVSAQMPAALADRINAAVLKAGFSAKVQEKLLSLGFVPTESLTAAQLQQDVNAEFQRNGAIVKTFNIQLNP